jgi:excisionase family DNA binding protein
MNLLTLREVAVILRISYYHAAALVREGIIPGVVRLQRRVLIREDALERFIQQGGLANKKEAE